MSDKIKSPMIFLSHASADKALVEIFETLLTKSSGVLSSDVFCSSLEGQGVPKGKSFVDDIRGQLVGSKAVVALITPAYLDSPFCIAELGAAWALQTRRIPIIVPPNSFEVMKATLLGITGVKIDDDIELSQALEELCEFVGVKAPTSGVRNRAMRAFQEDWKELKGHVAGPERIEAKVYRLALSERDDAINARDEAERLLSKAEKKIEALQKAKDKADVSAIDQEFSDNSWEEQLEEFFALIKDQFSEVGGREICRLLILNHLGKEVRPDRINFSDQVDRALELGVYDEDTSKWNFRHENVKSLLSYVDQVEALFSEYPEAVKALKARGDQSDPRTIRFWETHLSLR